MMAEKTGQMCEPEQLCGKYRADCLPFKISVDHNFHVMLSLVVWTEGAEC